MITCWAQTSDRRLATIRPAESIPPPGGNPTKSRTTRTGQACARATRGRTGSAAVPAAKCRNCLRWGSFMSPIRLQFYLITSSARFDARSRIARCEVRYNREKVLLVEIGYNFGHQRAPFSRSGAVLEVIELPEHVAR